MIGMTILLLVNRVKVILSKLIGLAIATCSGNRGIQCHGIHIMVSLRLEAIVILIGNRLLIDIISLGRGNAGQLEHILSLAVVVVYLDSFPDCILCSQYILLAFQL